MSKKKGRPTAPTSRRQQEQQPSGSLVIPVLVGVVLVGVIIAVIVSFESRRTTPSVAVIPTAAPQPTNPIPYPDVPRISVEDTQHLVARGEAVIVDVRSPESYRESHIAGAISVPETELEERIDELPRDVDLVLY